MPRKRLSLGGAGLASAISLLAAAPAHAQSVWYWYYGAGSNQNCWDTAAPSSGAEAYSCDTPAAGYFTSKTTGNPAVSAYVVPNVTGNGGAQGDSELTSPGDYCNQWGFAGFNSTDSAALGGDTGFNPPSPVSSYQYGDEGYPGYDNLSACQAEGSVWGELLSSGDSSSGGSNICYSDCGIEHFASVQGLGDVPWSTSFSPADPALYLYSNFNAYAFSPLNVTNEQAWGYVCAVLKDVSTSNLLEICGNDWNAPTGGGLNNVVACQTFDGYRLDLPMAQYLAAPKTSLFATTRAGSTYTTTATDVNGTYSLEITTTELTQAATSANTGCYGLDNTALNNDATKYSTIPSEYKLMGVEDGVESWNKTHAVPVALSYLGGNESNLLFATLY